LVFSDREGLQRVFMLEGAVGRSLAWAKGV
jgi:hypothetical protein